MGIFAFLSLLSCVSCLFIGCYVYSRDRKNASNRFFLYYCIAAAYWAFAEFMLRQAGSYSAACFWVKAATPWTAVMISMLYFAIVFTDNQKILKSRIFNALIII